MSSGRRSRRAAWACLLGLAGGCASGGAHETAVARPLERAAEPAERRGLAAIAAPLVAADVAFLAARELEGRDTPSRGLRIAARYLAHRLECLGFEPGAEAGWFHEWVLVEHSLDAEGTWAELATPGEFTSLEYCREYAVHPDELEDADVAGELVWCGEASRADFEGLALDGQIALVEEGSESRLRRRRRAADAGAAALVVLAEPLSEESVEQRFGDWGERCRAPWVRMPGERSAGLPVFWLAGEPARRLRELAAGSESGALLGARFAAGAEAVREVTVENVCGHWPGRDPALAGEVLLASAHYDHVGIQDGEVYCGADDNASGCAALLAVAEALAAYGPLERSVLLLWVSGEECGLLGAEAWAVDPWLPLGGVAIANVNLDMVGRNAPALLEYTPTAAHPEHNGLSECLVRLAPLEGFTELKSADKDYERSDHAAFAKHLGIPVLYVSTGEHEDYHQPSDTADKVDADKVARVARLVFRLLVEVAREGV